MMIQVNIFRDYEVAASWFELTTIELNRDVVQVLGVNHRIYL